MPDDDPPDNPWDTQVRILTLQGEDEEDARTEVIQQYLDVCDPRPLISAILKGRPISAMTGRRVAAIFDPEPRANESVPTKFGILPSQRRLRDYLKPDEAKGVKVLLAGHAALSEGRSPAPAFWKVLAYGLMLGHPEAWSGQPPLSPLRIRLKFRAQAHRPTDPELAIRNRVICWLVDEAVRSGMTKSAATEKVANDIGKSFETVRAAVYGGTKLKTPLI